MTGIMPARFNSTSAPASFPASFTTRRISADLPEDLVARLDRQAETMGLPRRDLLVAAVTSMLREFEAIDAECGVPCTCGSPRAHALWCAFQPAAEPVS